jgi:hypothetical protein
VIKISIFLFVALFALIAVAEVMIGSGVRRFSRAAQARFPGKRAEALIAMVECESCDMRDRNHAVWALGQLDDPRALAVLERYHTGEKCDHVHSLCQKTLGIALRHLRQEDNNRGEAFLWRWMLPDES